MMTLTAMDTGFRELVREARRGSLAAFAEVVRRERRRLVASARAILLDHHEAEDVAQEALVVAHARLRDLRDPGRFRPWASRILVRLAVRRKGRDRPRPSGDAADRLPERRSGGHPELQALSREFRRLPEKYRVLLSLFYLAGLSYAETAEATGLSVARVKSRLHDARGLLRRRLSHVRD
jgi:RNA polymerase sigma-70 factor (ECF subfamily)